LGLFDVLRFCKKGSVLSKLRRAQSDVTDTMQSCLWLCARLPFIKWLYTMCAVWLHSFHLCFFNLFAATFFLIKSPNLKKASFIYKSSGFFFRSCTFPHVFIK